MVRKRFRAEKKVEAAKQAADDQIRGRYGLPETLKLVAEDDKAKDDAREEWERGRREYEAQTSIRKARLSTSTGLVSGSSLRTSSKGGDTLSSLKARILDNTRRSSSNLAAKSKPPDRGRIGLK